MKIDNCGIVALEKMTQISNISMFTIIHLAKDNGVNLYFCKVEEDELIKVPRPAIFHQENHFVFVDNGKAMPVGKYTGYVLTTKPPNEPLPFSLAKKIHGQSILSSIGNFASNAFSSAKKAVSSAGRTVANVASRVAAPVARVTSSVVKGISAAIRPVVSAARQATSVVSHVAAPVIRSAAAAPQGVLKYVGQAAQQAPSVFNAAKMAAGGVFNTLSQTASKIAQPINSGTFGNSIYSGNNMTSGATVSRPLNLASGGTTSPGHVTTGPSVKNTPSLTSSFSGASFLPGQSTAAATMAGGGGSVMDSLNAQGNQPGGYLDRNQQFIGQTDPNDPFGFGQGYGSRMSPSSYSSSGQSGGGGGGGGGDSGGNVNYGDLSGLQNNSMANYSTATQFLGYGGLPTATRDELTKYANSSIDDLTKQFTQGNDQATRQLEEKHQQERNALMTQYANYGQDPMTSSDAQNKLSALDRQYAQAQSELTQNGQNAALDKAIQFKKEMLQNSMAQGQFDYNAAMDLAKQVGMDQQLNFALQSKNPEVLQNVLASIFQKGR